MVFAEPLWLFGLLALPLVAAVEAWAAARDQARVARLVARPLWARVLERRSPRIRPLRLGLSLLGAAGLVLALARPQWGIVREKVEREGVDVVLALDTSGSMATEDVPPNRFFLARAALSSLVARLEGDRFGLLAFEGEAYPLVPLTLDADAVGLFLETAEPGIVPAPGTSLGTGLARGLSMFVDKERHNRVMVLVSDGEDLEGDVDEAVRQAKEAGVVVHTVGVGTEAGQPVPDFDKEGKAIGFKKDEQGGAVVSRLNPATLEAIARGTGGRFFRITAADTSLSALAAAIEGMEQKTLAQEYSYRRKERFQVPLAIGLGAIAAALLVPLPRFRSARRSGPARVAAALAAVLLGAGEVLAQSPPPQGAATASAPVPAPSPTTAATPVPKPGVLDEVLLRPRRLATEGRSDYERGNHPAALQSFERAATLRPADPAARYNMADGLYKNGKFPEAATLYRSLAEDARSPLAAPSRYNLGNTLFQQQDYKGAINAYRDALRVAPDDPDTLRNLESALRALKQQEEQQKKQQQDKSKSDQDQDKKNQGQDKKDSKDGQKSGDKKPDDAKRQKPETPEEKEQKRFQQETGMPKDRAMQLLDALQQNEKNEQKKLLAAKRAERKKGKDW